MNDAITTREVHQLALSEAVECVRDGTLAMYVGDDLNDAIRTKHEFNKGRSYRHGGRKA